MTFNEEFAADIAAYRTRYLHDAVAAVLDAGYPADVIAQVAHIAEIRWVDEHPTLASRIEVAW